ncbi:MAG: 50S ribosomal protein L35 [Deltaproteobacteria bacterium]|nr:50S ribosomal protein L35 [Deltaproteobacteria bacterium]
MSKQKTHSGAKKRFSFTATGKIKRSKAYRRHILTSKTQKQKRNLRRGALVHHTNEAAIRSLLPYA